MLKGHGRKGCHHVAYFFFMSCVRALSMARVTVGCEAGAGVPLAVVSVGVGDTLPFKGGDDGMLCASTEVEASESDRRGRLEMGLVC